MSPRGHDVHATALGLLPDAQLRYRQHMYPCPVVDVIRELHTDTIVGGVAVCRHCVEVAGVDGWKDPIVRWPCPTRRALGEAINRG